MSDYNSDGHRVPSDASQTQEYQQPDSTTKAQSLSGFDIPSSDLDLDFFTEPNPEKSEKVQKRASNVMKLSLERKKLEEELRLMNERLEAAEQAASSKRSAPSISNRP